MFGDPVENKNGWIKLTVKEAVDQGYIARPLDGNHGAKHPKGDDYVEVGVPFIMAQDLKNKQVDFESCHFITEKQASTLKKGWAKTGDVLLTNKGTIGRVAIVQLSKYEDMLLTPQITYYRCLRDIDNEYLAAYFGTGFFVDQLEKLTTGTTRASVTITQQEKLELIIPPKPMQRKFAEFVSQSDKSKFSGFKSQFIEMSQKWKETAKYEPLANFMNNITYGFTNPMPDTEEGPWKVTAKDIVDGRINYQTARKTSRDAYEALTDKSRPKIGDVLLTKDGTLGRTALVEDADICINQSVAAIRCNDRIIPEFLVSLLQMPEYQERMLADAGGVTVKHLYITRVDKMPVLVPELDAQREWIAFIDQSDKSKLIAS